MIQLVTGTIGSGKTLYCVGRAVDAVAEGLTVYSNIRLNFEEIAAVVLKRNRRIIRPEQVRFIDLIDQKNWHEVISWGSPGAHVLVILDEVHLFFNARDWSKTQKEHSEMLSFLSQSRKACVDVIFIAQVAATLEKQFRVQCEEEIYCRSLRTISIPILGTMPFNRMLLVRRDGQTNNPLSRSIKSYDKDLWPCYDTLSFLDRTMTEASDSRTRLSRYKLARPVVFTRSRIVGALVALCAVCVCYFLS